MFAEVVMEGAACLGIRKWMYRVTFNQAYMLKIRVFRTFTFNLQQE
jgi:hypothetical protein